MAQGAESAVRHARIGTLAPELIRPRDVVLVKGSHALGLNTLAEALLAGH